ncbi:MULTISPECIES: succinyl-diaminopimelate desuccinylase [Legionella]|uniref:Succinyl-diaminopimelate desuccinylase n=1 Tax=Legionella steelei TaxID=947033 RepID=A0A0W0ZMR2_9GAMM|nr:MULTISPECIES: succinyl-diaminopimelate desuccinylase [Legionella]KTD70423.1 succinyl-diaminopimelate desuccinylase [Legionella steelei]MBN9226970.1 succinyl-diaminopimelate desuccinylase [Legionella steelei]OJW14151.1 MAG: succinyl-diaminopimelate desuccinylase [Legionella sp. 39-23]
MTESVTPHSELQEILNKLVRFPSITPEDAGCQEFMIQFLERIGFSCQRMNKEPVSNFFASYGESGPLLVFAGHTDVVPVGDATKWLSDPFIMEHKNGMLFGRGVADMKGSLACMLLMAQRFVKTYPKFQGRLGFLITSGEEGNDYDMGTPYVMQLLKNQGIHIDYCIVGEPSSTHRVGDVLKIGRRGSLSAKITLHGKQGHVAYPHLADNPIHKISPVLAELSTTLWDQGNHHFPPTSMQITHLQSGGQALNIIPGDLVLHLNFRYSTEQTHSVLKEKMTTIFQNHDLNPIMEWRLSGEPFLTAQGALLESCKEAIIELTKNSPELSTSGGTSDGRFIAPYGVEVVELGPVNATIHQVNECVSLSDLHQLETLYFSICEKLLIN